MTHLINLLSVIPMRKEPAHRSEMVSQLLFGETATVLEEKGDFILVNSLYDGYEGWCQHSQLAAVAETGLPHTDGFVGARLVEVLTGKNTILAPVGTPVYSLEQWSVAGIEIKYLIQPGQLWKVTEHSFTPQHVRAVYQHFMNTPYLWGGKSVFGIDCSGFVQQVYKMFGIPLLRDACLQATQGIAVDSWQDARYGDLLFFQNEAGNIVHVGLLIGESKIVHAAGKVKIDRMDQEGIVNSDTGRHTHRLHSIRRVYGCVKTKIDH